jgi:hypothetical protein
MAFKAKRMSAETPEIEQGKLFGQHGDTLAVGS